MFATSVLLASLATQTCWQRVYTTEHLAKNPKQAVMAFQLHRDEKSQVGEAALGLRNGAAMHSALRCEGKSCRLESLGSRIWLKELPDRLVVRMDRVSNSAAMVPADVYHLFPCENVPELTCKADAPCLIYGSSWDGLVPGRQNTWLADRALEGGPGYAFLRFSNGASVTLPAGGFSGNCMGIFLGVAVVGFRDGQPVVRTSHGPVQLPKRAAGIGNAQLILVDRATMRIMRRVPLPASTLGDFTFRPSVGSGGDVRIAQGRRCIEVLVDGSFRLAEKCPVLPVAELNDTESRALQAALGRELDSKYRILEDTARGVLLVYALGAAC